MTPYSIQLVQELSWINKELHDDTDCTKNLMKLSVLTEANAAITNDRLVRLVKRTNECFYAWATLEFIGPTRNSNLMPMKLISIKVDKVILWIINKIAVFGDQKKWSYRSNVLNTCDRLVWLVKRRLHWPIPAQPLRSMTTPIAHWEPILLYPLFMVLMGTRFGFNRILQLAAHLMLWSIFCIKRFQLTNQNPQIHCRLAYTFLMLN